MMMNGERSLAYIAEIAEIQPLDGYDRVEYARVNGWWVVVSKADNFSVGDKCIYFETDSLVNANDERFAFMEKKKYKVKIQKLCKVYSQGLIMPLSSFPEVDSNAGINTDLTEILKVKYYVPEDNARKAKTQDPNAKYKNMASRHLKLAKRWWWRKLYKSKAGKKILYLFFGKDKKDAARKFPEFVTKTDEDRIENMPFILNSDDEWVMTEKLDGTSATYALRRKRGVDKYEFYVCSRNVRQMDETQECYHDHNIYWDMAFKFGIEDNLKEYLRSHKNLEWVYIQGEAVGGVQGNPLKLTDDDLYIFNFVTSADGRFDSYSGKSIITKWGMKWVPILGHSTLPKDMEEMKLLADGMSVVNKDVRREGVVYRSFDGKRSFKNVSRKYLEKKHE